MRFSLLRTTAVRLRERGSIMRRGRRCTDEGAWGLTSIDECQPGAQGEYRKRTTERPWMKIIVYDE